MSEHVGRALSQNAEPMTQERTALHDYEGHTVIFLDVDGVLNCVATHDRIQGCTGLDDRKIMCLKSLADYFQADIVLSSSWKDDWEKEDKEKQGDFGNALDTRLGEQGMRIVDKTIDWECGKNRGQGILDWIEDHGPLKAYIILDDEPFDFKASGISRHWLKTSYWAHNGGLNMKHVAYIKRHEKLYLSD